MVPALERAAECGRLLREAKAQIGHGGFLAWVEQHLSFGHRQAQRYMRVAACVEAHPNATLATHLTLDGVLAAIAEPAQKPSRPKSKPKWEPANTKAEEEKPTKHPDLIAAVRDLNAAWPPAAIETATSVLTEQQRADLQHHLPDVLVKLQRLAEPVADAADLDKDEDEDADLEMPRLKRTNRPRRWAEACAQALDALEELQELRGEYQDWRQNLPENLQGSALAEKLDAIEGLDLQSAIEVIQEAECADLPLGFGRD
jgi:hypothetical protein